MALIDAKYHDIFQEEMRELMHRRANTLLWTGAVLLLAFAILDYMVVRSHFRIFFLLRVTATLFFLSLIYLNYLDRKKKHAFAIVTAAYLFAGVTISAMIVKMGGYSSYYYVGLVLLLITYAAIFPVTMKQTLLLGFSLYFIYSLPIFILNPFSRPDFTIFIGNTFFFFTFIVIIVVRSRAENKARRHEFGLRMQEKEMNEQLAFYADKLEGEVARRTRELQESENRYRDLYENIIDDVILIDREGKILLANHRFYESLHLPDTDDQELPFLDLVHADDREQVADSLLGRLQQGENVTGNQFRLTGRTGRIFEVECNATIIRKEGVLVGFQMLIRDISRRKEMEHALVESFETVQATRNATILGLAKLSEYRDRHSGNHLERIREYCQVIARELSVRPEYQGYITDRYIDDLYYSSILHDIGKVAVPDDVLLKPGALSREEMDIIRQHTLHGGDTLKAVEARTEGRSFLSMAKSIAYYHHEKWNGTGYPFGLREENIHLSARIVALADVYDALTNKPPSMGAISHAEAVNLISRERGRQFAPDVVDAFIKHEKTFDKIRKMYHKQKKDSREVPGEDCCGAKKRNLENYTTDLPSEPM